MSRPLVIALLSNPQTCPDYSLKDWDLIIRQARATRLLSTLHARLEQKGELEAVPIKPRQHLIAARIQADKIINSARWEVAQIKQALEWLEMPVVYLKGVAYVLRDLPCSAGRIFSDVDFLVNKADLERIEKELVDSGWEATKLDPYDQEYYRRWMHEIPPLVNSKTGTAVDIHHNILPDTVRLRPDPQKMLSMAQKLPNEEYFYTLTPIDMVIHSATHLFHEGELENGLRDLVDLDALFRHFGEQDVKFWEDFVPRAKELNLGQPAYYAVRYAQIILGTPIPTKVVELLSSSRPNFPWLMDFFFLRALMPNHASCNDRYTGFARWILYVRSHYLRMPMHLLIPHLIRKAWKRRFDEEKDSAQ